MGEVVINSLFVKFGLFIGTKVQRPTFIGESGIGDGVLGCDEVKGVGLGNIVGDDVVLGNGREKRERYMIVLVASDPNPFD